MEHKAPRLASIDAAKGLGILTIALTHYDEGVVTYPLRYWLTSFMICVFYGTSGWLLGNAEGLSTRQLARKRLRQLGVPYLWWSGIILAFDVVLCLCHEMEWQIVGRDVYKTLILRGIGTLWFLPAVGIAEVLSAAVARPKRWWLVPIVGAVLLWSFQWLLRFSSHFEGALNNVIVAPAVQLRNIFTAYLSVLFALVVARWWRAREGNRSLGLTLLWAALLLFGAFVARGWMPKCLLFAYPYLGAVLFPVGLVLLLRVVERGWRMPFLSYWGRHSLCLMVTHFSLVRPLMWLLWERVLGLEHTKSAGFVLFLLSLPLQAALAYVVERHAPQLLGRRKHIS